MVPDSSFGVNGIFNSTFPGNAISSVKLDNGKLLNAGIISTNMGNRVQVTRLNADGTVDQTFNPGGGNYKIIELSELNHLFVTLLRLPDGNILLTVDLENQFTDRQAALVVINQNGEVQNSFNGTGKLLYNVSGLETRPIASVLSVDNKILTSGIFRYEWPYWQAYIRKYNLDGTPDQSFGNKGELLLDNFASEDVVGKLLLAQDGSILVIGSAHVPAPNETNGHRVIQVKRVTAEGVEDNTFGDNGRALSDLKDDYDGMIFIHGSRFINNSIIVTGRITNNPARQKIYSEMFCMKVKMDGSYDSGFKLNEKPIFNFSDYSNSLYEIFTLGDTSGFYVGGIVGTSPSTSRAVLLRITNKGEIDKEFANLGLYDFPTPQPGGGYASGFETMQGELYVTGSITSTGKGRMWKYLKPMPRKIQQEITLQWPDELPCIIKKYALPAKASSGLPVVLKVVSGPGFIKNDSLVIEGTGYIRIVSTQSGNEAYKPVERTDSIRIYQEANCGQRVVQKLKYDLPPYISCVDRKYYFNGSVNSGLPLTTSIVSGPGRIVNDTIYFSGIGQISLKITQEGDENYKPLSTEITLNIHPDPECEVKVYDFITPDNDGKNDFLEVKNLSDISRHELSIFDRWGALIFTSDNYQNNWNGAEVPGGIYYYVFRSGDDLKNELKGSVLVKK
jgi:gliding motility-associated-like protein/uncharacterized delta-60 repeat protein